MSRSTATRRSRSESSWPGRCAAVSATGVSGPDSDCQPCATWPRRRGQRQHRPRGLPAPGAEGPDRQPAGQRHVRRAHLPYRLRPRHDRGHSGTRGRGHRRGSARGRRGAVCRPPTAGASRGVDPTARDDEAATARRRALRTQIATLERAIAEIEAEHPGVGPAPAVTRRAAGPTLLSAEELERVRSALVRRLAAVQARSTSGRTGAAREGTSSWPRPSARPSASDKSNKRRAPGRARAQA